MEVNKNREAFPGKLLRVDWAQAGPGALGVGDRATGRWLAGESASRLSRKSTTWCLLSERPASPSSSRCGRIGTWRSRLQAWVLKTGFGLSLRLLGRSCFQPEETWGRHAPSQPLVPLASGSTGGFPDACSSASLVSRLRTGSGVAPRAELCFWSRSDMSKGVFRPWEVTCLLEPQLLRV